MASGAQRRQNHYPELVPGSDERLQINYFEFEDGTVLSIAEVEALIFQNSDPGEEDNNLAGIATGMPLNVVVENIPATLPVPDLMKVAFDTTGLTFTGMAPRLTSRKMIRNFRILASRTMTTWG